VVFEKMLKELKIRFFRRYQKPIPHDHPTLLPEELKLPALPRGAAIEKPSGTGML